MIFGFDPPLTREEKLLLATYLLAVLLLGYAVGRFAWGSAL